MKKTTMTPKEYASIRGISLQAVTKAIKMNHSMPGVKKIEKFGRFYLLTVNENELCQKEN